MKKFMALLCAGILACSMGMVAFANESPSSSTTENKITGSSTVDDVKVWDSILVDGKEVDNGYLVVTEATEAQVSEGLQKAAEVSTNAEVIVVQAYYVGEQTFGKITIPFNLKNVVAGQKVTVLHKRSTDNVWETLTPDKVENGKVTVTFNSLSPVVFIIENGTGSVASPKTADTTAVYVVFFAAAALVGAAVTGKKAFR